MCNVVVRPSVLTALIDSRLTLLPLLQHLLRGTNQGALRYRRQCCLLLLTDSRLTPLPLLSHNGSGALILERRGVTFVENHRDNLSEDGGSECLSA